MFAGFTYRFTQALKSLAEHKWLESINISNLIWKFFWNIPSGILRCFCHLISKIYVYIWTKNNLHLSMFVNLWILIKFSFRNIFFVKISVLRWLVTVITMTTIGFIYKRHAVWRGVVSWGEDFVVSLASVLGWSLWLFVVFAGHL